jgi:hypothetical protein
MNYKLSDSVKHLSELKSLTTERLKGQNLKAFQDNETPMPDSVISWLSRLSLFYGVPFEHLVPNPKILPHESIRFFYIDPNWTDALIDGALSVGVQSSADKMIQLSVRTSMRQMVRAEQKLVRRRLAKAELPEELVINEVFSGLLLRSQLVSGWPGMQIVPYEKDASGTKKIAVMRMERLAPDVLFCLFEKVPDLVVISEPEETLCFGVTGGFEGKGMLARYIGANDTQPVATYVPNIDGNYVKAQRRPNTTDILDVLSTRDLFADVLKRYNALRPGTTTLSPADFAIQMVKVAEMQSFISGQTPGPKDCKENE